MFVCYVSKQDTNTEVILGNDWLQAIGINCNCNGTNNTISWFDTKNVPYKPRDNFNVKDQMYIDFLESKSPQEAFNDDEEHEEIPHRF